MTLRLRRGVVAFAGLIVLGATLWACAGLPRFGDYRGPYGVVLNEQAPSQRKIPNVITAVNFDYRGLDTLGEENILFAAVAGLALVLRRDREELDDYPLPAAPGRRQRARTDATRAFGVLAVFITAAYGVYLAIHPHLTPGGGFQGGAITAGLAAAIFLTLGYRTLKRLTHQERVEFFEALGAGAYALIGLAMLGAGGAYLINALPLGGEGLLFSTGTIPLINFFVALEVCTGFVLVFLEFARETRIEKAAEEDA